MNLHFLILGLLGVSVLLGGCTQSDSEELVCQYVGCGKAECAMLPKNASQICESNLPPIPISELYCGRFKGCGVVDGVCQYRVEDAYYSCVNDCNASGIGGEIALDCKKWEPKSR